MRLTVVFCRTYRRAKLQRLRSAQASIQIFRPQSLSRSTCPIWPVHSVDGDTSDFLEDDGRRAYSVRRDRDLGINTPEMHSADPEQRKRAIAAKAFRESWFGQHLICNQKTVSWPRLDGSLFSGYVEVPYFILRSEKPDAFDRWLSTIRCQLGHVLPQALLDAGYAEPFHR
jgi:hypothetical protein